MGRYEQSYYKSSAFQTQNLFFFGTEVFISEIFIRKNTPFHKLLFLQDKREIEASLTLGLTMRGIQIFQVGK